MPAWLAITAGIAAAVLAAAFVAWLWLVPPWRETERPEPGQHESLRIDYDELWGDRERD